MQATLTAAQPRQTETGPQGRLLRGYLHKTSNTLCGIKGYATLIAGDGPGTETAAAWARKIIREVERLEDIFRSVGDLSTTAAAAPCGREACAPFLEDVIDAAAAESAALAMDMEIDCGAVPAAEPLLPAADLRLVLRELLANAAEGRDGLAGARHARVTATLMPTGRVALCISDDGPGMAADLAAQAVDPFVTTKNDHAGVGLTRVETLMDMYGLAWHLSSTAGTGTTVTLEVGRTPDNDAS